MLAFVSIECAGRPAIAAPIARQAPAPNPMTGTPRDASMMTGKSAGNEVPTAPPASAPVARAKTTASQAASVTSVTGTRLCRALCIALRKRPIPTPILVPLSECRVVIASSTILGAFRSKTALGTTSKAPARAAVAVLNAPSISPGSRIPSGSSFHPRSRAADSVSRWFDAESKLHVVGLVASRADPVRARGTSQAEASVKTMGALRQPAPLVKRGEAGAAPGSDP
jgi:hypothetical protein